MNKKILYIGNNLVKSTKYLTTMETLSHNLNKEFFIVYKYSNKINKVSRLLDMCFSIIKHRKNVDYVLIDTYSTINFYYAFFTSQIARIFNLKYIPILHGGNLPKRIDKSKYLSKLIFKNSYKNIAPSNYLKFAFESHNFISEFIPNSLEIKTYNYKKRKVIRPKLLWVRAFNEIYNPTLAIKVLCLLKEEYPEAKLCMVGPFVDESYRKSVDLVKKNNLENIVEFTDVLLKEQWHKKSLEYDIFINTTNYDNTPVSVMEAMALGLTIVSTNVGGIPFLLDDKINSLLVSKNNPEEMTTKIISILDGNFPDLATNARKKVENFDWEVVKNKWIKILK